MRCHIALLLMLFLVSTGCGHSQDVISQQELQLQEMIHEAKTDPANISPAEREMRRNRLEMDFGPEAVPLQSSP